MMSSRGKLPLLVAALVAVASGLMAQGGNTSVGPDVIVGDITGPSNYTSVGTTKAYSLGTTSCNIGSQVLLWIASTNQHPVIAQNLYMVDTAGGLKQIGMSWLKHGFTALQGTVCGACNANPNGSALGVGCSDPYGSGLNGSQGGLGPRSEVNAATGFFPYPYGGFTGPYNSVDKRLQVNHADLALSGTQYIGESQYVSPDDAAAGNKNNNSSYRLCNVSAAPNYTLSFSGPTVRRRTAAEGWQDLDPSVNIQDVEVPNDGRIIVASKGLDLGNGNIRYIYAIHNQNSDRSVGGLTINLPSGSSPANFTFHDVDYHTNEPYSGADWTLTVAANGITWNTESFATNANANAIRWGTTYTFSFEVNASVIVGDAILTLFKPGSPSSMIVPTPFGPVFSMAFASSGGGVGNLTVALTNIPAGTVQGYSLYSLNATGAVGGGSVFGLYPDSLTLLSLISAALPGSPLHWSWPVNAPNYPAGPYIVPNGGLASLSGMNADAVTVALDVSGILLGQTEIQRTTF